MKEVDVERSRGCRDTRRDLRRPAHDPPSSVHAPSPPSSPIDYGRGREGTAPTTLCEDIGIRELRNVIDELLELVRGINGRGNLREGIVLVHPVSRYDR